jgi:hypothetical protein
VDDYAKKVTNKKQRESRDFAYFLMMKKEPASSSETSVRTLNPIYFVSCFNFNYA